MKGEQNETPEPPRVRVIEYKVPIIDLSFMEKDVSMGHREIDFKWVVSMNKVVVAPSCWHGTSYAASETATLRWYIFECEKNLPDVCGKMWIRGACLVDLIPISSEYRKELDAVLDRTPNVPCYVWVVTIL